MHLIARISIIAVFVIYPIHTFGHSFNFKHATIVKNDSSFLSGLVQNSSESALSLEIMFKDSAEVKTTRTIPIKEIKRIVFSKDSLVFCTVPYRRRADTFKTTEYRLAKQLLSGYAELYKLQLPPKELNIVFETDNTFVYIIKINGRYAVLDQTEKLEGTTYKIRKGYIGTLRTILADHEELQKKLPKIKFRDSHIIPLVSALNAEHPEVPSKVFPVREKPEYRVGFSSGYTTFDGIVDPRSTGFTTICGIEVCHPEISRKLFTALGVSVTFLRDSISERNHNTLILWGFPITAGYNLMSNPISPFVSIGMTLYPQLLIVPLRVATGVSMFNSFSLGCSLESMDPWFRSENIISLFARYQTEIGI